MAKWMSCKGVGSRFSILVRRAASKRRERTPSVALALLAAATFSTGIGCSTAEGARTTPSAGAEPAGPEQVVQRMAPEQTQPAGSSTLTQPSAGGPVGHGPADTRVSSAGVTRVDSRPAASEPITSKHLEAELNRLEAELGR